MLTDQRVRVAHARTGNHSFLGAADSKSGAAACKRHGGAVEGPNDYATRWYAPDFTRQVIDRLEQLLRCARLRALVAGLIRHLHEFAIEESLTEAELMAGIGFLTEVGHITTDQRQEFILLSDTLGLSMLVDLINHGAGSSATESTVLGPFYVEGSPWRSNGDAIDLDDLGDHIRLLVSGHVRDDIEAGRCPVRPSTCGKNATNRLYAVQDETQSPREPCEGTVSDRRRRRRFAFRAVRPVDYPIPDDGPVGRMLKATGRHPWRPAHIHFIVSAGGRMRR